LATVSIVVAVLPAAAVATSAPGATETTGAPMSSVICDAAENGAGIVRGVEQYSADARLADDLTIFLLRRTGAAGPAPEATP